MGIKGLKALINKYYTNKNHDLSELQDKCVSIDLSIFLHRSLHKKTSDNISNIFQYFITILTKLKKFNIKPIFVFDGKPPKEKDTKLENRRNKRLRAIKRVESLNKLKSHINENDIDIIFEDTNEKNIKKEFNENHYDGFDSGVSMSSSLDSQQLNEIIDNSDDENYISSVLTDSVNSANSIEELEENIKQNIIKQEKKSVGIKEDYINKLKELFNNLNISYIHIEEEADIVCKYLVTEGIVHGCISDDMDLIAYGCKLIIQNFNFTNDDIHLYYYDEIIKNMKLTTQQMTDLCICSGTDYNNKIINLKCEQIYELLHKFKSIESLIENINNINKDIINSYLQNKNINENMNDITNKIKTIKIPYQFDYQNSRNIFNKSIDNIKEYIINFNDDKIINMEEVINYLVENIKDWSYYKIYYKVYSLFNENYNNNNDHNNINISNLKVKKYHIHNNNNKFNYYKNNNYKYQKNNNQNNNNQNNNNQNNNINNINNNNNVNKNTNLNLLEQYETITNYSPLIKRKKNYIF